jgi:hypothetical protein
MLLSRLLPLMAYLQQTSVRKLNQFKQNNMKVRLNRRTHLLPIGKNIIGIKLNLNRPKMSNQLWFQNRVKYRLRQLRSLIKAVMSWLDMLGAKDQQRKQMLKSLLVKIRETKNWNIVLSLGVTNHNRSLEMSKRLKILGTTNKTQRFKKWSRMTQMQWCKVTTLMIKTLMKNLISSKCLEIKTSLWLLPRICMMLRVRNYNWMQFQISCLAGKRNVNKL